MRLDRVVTVGVALCVVLGCAAAPAWAQRDRRDGDRREEFRREDRRDGERMHVERAQPPRGYVLDRRFHHDRYYPPRGHVVEVLPPGHRVMQFRGTPFFFHDGVWFRRSGVRFVVVAPPIGIVVPILPPFYTTIWFGGVPYYYADDAYYVWRPEQNGYVVSEAPPESQITEQPATAEQLFIYPKNRQSEQQQATDRYDCHRWAADQSTFDPTQPGGNVPDAQRTAKRADYQRAMKACLEARGYSVQ